MYCVQYSPVCATHAIASWSIYRRFPCTIRYTCVYCVKHTPMNDGLARDIDDAARWMIYGRLDVSCIVFVNVL